MSNDGFFTDIDIAKLRRRADGVDAQLAEKATQTQVMRKLISRTIAAGETVAAITWTQDDVGSVLALTEADVRIFIPTNALSVGTIGYIFCRINDISTGYVDGLIGGATPTDKVVIAMCRSTFGANRSTIVTKPCLLMTRSSSSSDGTTGTPQIASAALPQSLNAITKIYMYVSSGLASFPTGTSIEIWGRTV